MKDEEGQISIDIQHKDERLVLQISDNGKGLSSSLETLLKSHTLGIQLIYTIAVKQLGGTLECFNDKGVTWMIQFNYLSLAKA